MNNLYVLVGVIASGKSTWAKKFVKDNPNTKIVCPDSLRTMLNGTYVYVKGLDKEITLICQQAIQVLLQGGYDVVVDCCNNDRMRRLSWLGAASFDRDVNKIAVVFPIRSEDTHITFAMQTDKNLSWKEYGDIYKLHINQQEPIDDENEGFDEKWCVNDQLEVFSKEVQ